MKRARFDDLGFRVGTGLFGVILISLVAGIAWILYTDAQLAIWKFGFQFWQTEIWDPVSGEFGARPFIWGTLYSSVLALIIADDRSRSASPSTSPSCRRHGCSGRWCS